MNTNTFFANFELLTSVPDGITKLRELILQFGVQGKLIPQSPEFGSVSSLLDKIRDERTHSLMAQRTTVKTFPPVELDRCPFSIPDSWRWVRLAEIGVIVGGSTPRTGHLEPFTEHGTPWLTPADLYRLSGKMVSKGKRDLSEQGLRDCSAKILPPGTVLFSSRAPIGYVAIAANCITTNQGFKSCVPFCREMSEFIYYYLKSAAKRIDQEASGTTFKEVSGKEVAMIPFPLPPLEEQRRIVAKLDHLFALCDQLEDKLRQSQSSQEQIVASFTHHLLNA
jgi:type I restriction enzyme S subunit